MKRKVFFEFSQDKRSKDVEKWAEEIARDQESMRTLKIVTDPEVADIIVIVGGDGTMLHAIDKYHKLNKIFLGIDRGTLGFLLNPAKNLAELTDILISDPHKLIKLRLIEILILTNSGEQKKDVAFNDVFIKSDTVISGKVKTFGEFASEKRFRGDGLIVATSQGSTAYNRGAGGFILPLEEDLLAVTTICPQTEKIQDVVEMREGDGTRPAPSSVAVFLDKMHLRKPATLFVDNRQYENVIGFFVSPSSYSVKLAFTKASNFQIKRFHINEVMERRMNRRRK